MSLRNRPASSNSGSSSSPTSSPRSKMGHRSVNSSSDSASFDLKARHRHNDYSCYIHVINKTGTDLELVDSKHKSGHWAGGSPPRHIRPDVDTLIELTDPKGPHGSEGWCSYRFHHPERSNAVTFKLKFGDPYWVRDDNYLHASTSHPDLVSVRVPKYQTSGHPFIAYAEIVSTGSTYSHVREIQDRVGDHSSEDANSVEHSKEYLEGSLKERSPRHESRSAPLTSLSKTPMHNVVAVEVEDDQHDLSPKDKRDDEVAVIELFDDQDDDTKGDDTESEEVRSTKDEGEKTAEVPLEARGRIEGMSLEVSESDEAKENREQLEMDMTNSIQDLTSGTLSAESKGNSHQERNKHTETNDTLATMPTTLGSETSGSELNEEQSIVDDRTPQIPEIEQHEAKESAEAENVEVVHVAGNPGEEESQGEHDPQRLDQPSLVQGHPAEQHDGQKEPDQTEISEQVTDDVESMQAKEHPQIEPVLVLTDAPSGEDTNTSGQSSRTTTEHTTELRPSTIDLPTSQEGREQDEFDEDDYVRVMESKFETLGSKDGTVESNKTSSWDVFQYSHVRLGVVATIFLASYGFTMMRISRGLWLGGFTRRRS